VKTIALLLAIPIAWAAEQPVPFGHKTHAAAAIKCQDCHPNPDPGRAMTLPAASKCMTCHATIATDKSAIQKLAKWEGPIVWVRVATVPAFVFWSHRPHLKAGLKCEACHGAVAEMDVTTAAGPMKMAKCVDCHREKKATVECAACHDLN